MTVCRALLEVLVEEASVMNALWMIPRYVRSLDPCVVRSCVFALLALFPGTLWTALVSCRQILLAVQEFVDARGPSAVGCDNLYPRHRRHVHVHGGAHWSPVVLVRGTRAYHFCGAIGHCPGHITAAPIVAQGYSTEACVQAAKTCQLCAMRCA